MLGIRKIQEAALTRAIAIRTAAEAAGTTVTKAATIQMAALNAVSKASPWLILATGIAAAAAALFALTKNADEATEAQKKQAAETERLQKRNEDMAQTVGKSVGDVLAKYKSLQVQWSLLSTEHEKTKWVKDNSDAFRQLGLNVKSVTDAEQVLVNMSAQVIAALKAVAEAEAYSDLYKQSIQRKATEWDRRTKSHQTGDTYTVYHAGDAISDAEARAAGVRTNAERTTTTTLGGYATHTSVSNLTKQEIDRVNTYRRNEARKLNKELESQYDEDTNYYLSKWTDAEKAAAAARAQIPQNLQYNGNGGSVGNYGNSTPNKPSVEVEPKFADGSLADLENQLSELQSKYKNGLITLTPSDYQKKVNELTQAIENKKIELGLFVPEDKVTKQLQAVEEKNAKLARSQSFSSFDIATGANLPQSDRDISYIQSQMDFNDQLLQQLRELQDAYKALGDAGKHGLSAISAEIENVTNKQSQLGAKAKEYTDHDKRLKEQTETWSNIGNAVGKVGGAFSSLGGAFEIPELNIAGIIAQSIANIISAYTQAAGSPAVTSTGWGWLGFALTGLAEVASVISQIHSLSGYAEGGLIKGNGSLIKDDTLIMAHTGEMVLN